MTTWVEKLSTGDVSPYLSLSVFIYVCICAYACLDYLLFHFGRGPADCSREWRQGDSNLIINAEAETPGIDGSINDSSYDINEKEINTNYHHECFRVQIFSKDRTYSLGGTMELAQGRQFRG